jgi:hypothetical protein
MAIGTRFEVWNRDSMGKWSSLKCVITIAVRARPFNNMLPNWDALWFTEAYIVSKKRARVSKSKGRACHNWNCFLGVNKLLFKSSCSSEPMTETISQQHWYFTLTTNSAYM